MWKSVSAITLGAVLGALLRWLLGLKLNALFPTIPPGTLAANLIPRYHGDVAVPRGGVRGVIPDKQNY
jgi:fluoride exporter